MLAASALRTGTSTYGLRPSRLGPFLSAAENETAQVYAVGTAPVLRRLETAVTSWAGANGLVQHDAVGHAFGGPIVGAGTTHVNDGKLRIDFSRLLGNFPTIHPAFEVNVGHERAVFGLPL
jgi:hypothetical protein